MKPIKQELEERGLLYQNSNEELFQKIDSGEADFYCGFDPTADSLHLGNFIGFMVAVHLMKRGNKYTALTGGATGMIGDPGGKNSERDFLSLDDLEKNQISISKQISGISDNLQDFTGDTFRYDFVNNKSFYENMNFLDFLREVGKFMTVNVMMGKDTVKKRIEDPSQSISYTEFSYQLLQGYDFCRLHKDSGVILQIGGQDQWGNLVTGTELIRKKYESESYALTWPLITDSSGKKFGKSEGNALFLDKNKTSPYEIYQYFMNTADEELARYLKMLTLIEVEDIDKIVEDHMTQPEKRTGQKTLAFKVVEIIHGTIEAEQAEKITDFMFGAGNKVELLGELSPTELTSYQLAMGGVDYNEQNLFGIMVESGLAKSNSEARNAVSSGAVLINGEKISDPKTDISTMFLKNNSFLLQKGKKNLRIIKK
ncbi:MAG: tyrosine--tRNA ligase [Candidatus Gracilibacteria bacterium]|nr:tyrosine--tRNA ligase [Candidatus Gracilibacteria bacterium]